MRCPTLPAPRRRASAFVALAAAAFAIASVREARASDAVSAEIGAGMSKPTPTIASAPFEYQKIAGRWEPSDPLSLSASMRLTHDFAAAPTPDTTLVTRSDWTWLATLDGSYDVSKHVTLGLGAFGSSPARRDVASPFDHPPSAQTYGTVRTANWNAGATADVQYDTFDDEAPHDVDAAFDASIGYSHFDSAQTMTAIDGGTGPVTMEALAQRCGAALSAECRSYAAAAQTRSAQLEQVRLGATVTATLWDHTDLGVDAGYYLYSPASPGDVAFFKEGITNGPNGTASWGAGMPLLPPRWSVRPEIAQRWEALSVRAYYQLASYAVDPSEVGHTVGGKAELRLGKWRPYTIGSYRADVASGEPGASSWTLGLGVTRAF